MQRVYHNISASASAAFLALSLLSIRHGRSLVHSKYDLYVTGRIVERTLVCENVVHRVKSVISKNK